ncbi:MAG: AAA family ATPase [Pyrinomonadaceae bacterium]
MDKRLIENRRELERWCRDHGKSRDVRARLLRVQANEHMMLPNGEINMFEARPASEWVAATAGKPAMSKLFDDLWLAGELSILFADTGIGKSILAVQIAEAIARGHAIEPFEMTAAAQKVLYFDFELSQEQFAERYARVTGSERVISDEYKFSDNIVRAQITWDGPPPLGYESTSHFMYRSMLDWLEKSDARIMIVDNISYLNDSTHSPHAALRLMKALKELKRTEEVSVLVLAHTPKRAFHRELTVNDLQGSKMLSNFADNVFAIGRCRDDADLRYIKHIKQRSSAVKFGADNVIVCRLEKEFNFPRFRFERFCFESEFIHHGGTITDEERERLVNAAAELRKAGRSERQIAVELNISNATAHRYLRISES